ncbi:MAG: tetratricopeptide repeat protein [Gemmatimonadetes bacterium]|nr:tetratricopeptide repeat protein [Gemmatimonadota bacterium]
MIIKSRFEIALLAALAVLLTGCASGAGGGGGGGGGEGGGATDAETARPRQDTHTNSAEFFLLRAPEADNPAEAFQQGLAAAMNGILQNPTNPLAYLLAGRAQIGLGPHLSPDSMIAASLAADSLFTRAEELYPPYLEETVVHRENAWINLFNASLEVMDTDTDVGIWMLETSEVVFTRMRPEALHNLGVIYGNEGRFDEAIDTYGALLDVVRSRIEEVDSVTAASWRQREQDATFNRANILTRAERYEEAAQTYVEYLESAPGDVQALSGLAGALASGGQADSAQAIYNSLLDATGLGVRQYMDIGVGLYRSAQTVDTAVVDPKPIYGEAARAFRFAADISPRNRDAVYNMGQSLAEAEDWEALVPIADQLLELDAYNPQTYLLRALALNGVGEQEEAIEVYTQADSLGFKIEYPSPALAPRTGGGGVASLLLTNNSLDPGTPVEIRVHFSGDDGRDLGSVDIRVEAPGQGVTVTADADLSNSETVSGFYVEVLSPR